MWHPENPIRHSIPEARWPTQQEAARSLLFTPIQVGPITLESRTWVPAMVPWRATDDGFVTPNIIEWYGRFAAGRPGAIVVEATGIRDIASGPLLRIGHDRFVPGLRDLVAVVRERSAGRTRLFIQLIDFLTVRRRPEPARYFERYLAVGPALRDRLAGALADPRWREVPEPEVRARLAAAERPLVEAVLDAAELEAL